MLRGPCPDIQVRNSRLRCNDYSSVFEFQIGKQLIVQSSSADYDVVNKRRKHTNVDVEQDHLLRSRISPLLNCFRPSTFLCTRHSIDCNSSACRCDGRCLSDTCGWVMVWVWVWVGVGGGRVGAANDGRRWTARVTCLCTSLCLGVSACLLVFVCNCVCVGVSMCVCVCVCVYASVSVSMFLSVYLCVCLCLCESV